MEQEELHQFPDGSIHSFPTGTDPEVIKREILKSAPQAPPLSSSPTRVPISLDPTAGLRSTQQVIGPSKNPTSLEDVLSDIQPLIRTGASTAVGALGGIFGGPAGSAFGFSAADELLRRATGEPTGAISGTKNLGLSIPEAGVENLATGKLLTGAARVLKGIFSGASEIFSPSDLASLKPTASQVGPTPNSHPILKTIEDMFAPTSKRIALDESAKQVLNDAENRVQALTGSKNVLPAPHQLATKISDDLETQFNKSLYESNSRAGAAKLIAEANEEQIPNYAKVPTGLKDAQGNPIMAISQQGSSTIKGRVESTKTVGAIKGLLDEMTSSTTGVDPESKPFKILNSMLDSRQMLDDQGNIVSKPLSFAQAWKDKQIVDGIGHGSSAPEVDYNDTRFQKIAKAINDDIGNSLPNWQVNGDKASTLWNEAKQIVSKRHDLFDDTLKTLNLSSVTTPDDRVNKIIDNSQLLKKSLIAGKLQIPDDGGFKYVTSNTRKDLQGYQLMRMVNESTVPDPANPQAKVLNPVKLYQQWQAPENQESLKTLFSSQNRADIDQAFKNYALVSQKAGVQGTSRFMAMRMGARGLDVGAGLALALAGMTASTHPQAALGLGAITGATLGFHGMAKLMTSPTFGRIIGQAFQGSAMGMSQRAVAQTMANTIKGELIDFYDDKGNKQTMKVNANGKLEPSNP